ncbi:MAG: D-glycero-beta-D-manno-heptose-7-phosphate kinase [Candidatus Omnitrophota bacterium]|nr:MAG: D-glycero-beta-D-manno-heptose-7-phosphate kinase [Candidatus Omnitrophota bacterium]
MSNFKKIINNFQKAKILVVGDLILDEYIWGEVERISPEAPVPVVWANRRTYIPGGAANVASNISSLGSKATLVGVIGNDKNRDIFLSQLKKRKVSVAGVVVDVKRTTTLKTRIIAGHQQVVRLDWEDTDSLPRQANQKIMKFVEEIIDKFDAVIIEDYGKGVINMYLLESLIRLAHSRKKIITVDPKVGHFQYYKGVTSITPNRRELENAIRNLKIKDTCNQFRLNLEHLSCDREINLAAKEILRYLGLESILITLGEQGMKLIEKNGRITNIPTVAQEVFDVSGAGDTVIATFTLALCSGASKIQAAHLANFAAGIVVGKIGTATTNKKELLQTLGNR